MRAGATCVVLAACLGASAVALSHEQEQVVFMDNGITNDVGQGQRLPLVSSEALEGAITANKLMARARKLYEIAQESREEYGRPTRVIGSKGHRATLAYIISELSTAPLAGFYRLAEQFFPAVSGTVFSSRLVLGNSVPRTAHAMSLSPPTPRHEPVFAPLELAGRKGCTAADFPVDTIKGSVALVERGECTFSTKSALAGKAGAKALVVYNNEPGAVAGTLGTPEDSHVPTFGMSREEALPFVAALKEGKKIDAIAYVDSVVSMINTTNIVAQTVGGDPDNCVMLGAHSDSVPEGPGINDDGSGTLALLEVATALASHSVNNCVRFAWWSGEEEGLLGSDYYVAHLAPEENQRIRLFMDYDMLASPNFAYQVYDARDSVNPKGSQALRDLYTAWYEKNGLNWTYIPFDGRSDYDGFIRYGIPAGGVATGAEVYKTEKEKLMFGGEAGVAYDKCYHQLCDDVGNVNVTAWVLNTKLVAHSVATYAVSFDGFPRREAPDSFMAQNQRDEYNRRVKYHGSKLYI